jgi:hypothetical protein
MVGSRRTVAGSIARFAAVCWSASWRAVLATILGNALVALIASILIRSWGGPVLAVLGSLISSVPAGLLAGLIIGTATAIWFDPPRDPRRYHRLACALGASCVLGVILVMFGDDLFYKDDLARWHTPGDMLGGWPAFWGAMVSLAVCGWLAGWWAAHAHISRWERVRAAGKAGPEDS